jgi:hypothetical protein
MPNSPATLDRIDDILGKSERTLKATRWLLTLVAAGVLWGGRLEWGQVDHERRITATEADVKPLSESVARMKGHLGLASSHTLPLPKSAAVVWSDERKREEERQESEAEQAPH